VRIVVPYIYKCYPFFCLRVINMFLFVLFDYVGVLFVFIISVVFDNVYDDV
jgi:hypothetical protein